MRKDLSISNDGCAYLLAGIWSEDGSDWPAGVSAGDDWQRLARAGMGVVFSESEDGGASIRVVLGPLSQQEADEWICRSRGWLRLPKGQMVILSGFEDGPITPAWLESEAEGGWYGPERKIELAPGNYLVDVLGYLPGTASYLIQYDRGFSSKGDPEPLAEDHPFSDEFGRHEPFASWFRRTRPGQDFPAWLVNETYHRPEEDPETEKLPREPGAYEALQAMYAALGGSYVQYVVHLTPLAGEPDSTLLETFSDEWELRKPTLCPLGFVAPTPAADAQVICL